MNIPSLVSSVQRGLEVLDPTLALRLARLMILQDLCASDARHGRALAKHVIDLHGAHLVPKKWAKIFFDSAIQAAEVSLASFIRDHCSMDGMDAQFADADLLHPMWGGAEDGWLKAMNHIFHDNGLEPLSLRPTSENIPYFDRIEFCAPAVAEGPLITVIVTAWNPRNGLVSSVRSLLCQTWKNLEVIIVDDGSRDEFRPLLRMCGEMDPRIRVIELPDNQGTYAARNAGLAVSRGQFITFQDSDDFSHPRRLEMQVGSLLRSPQLMATRSSALGLGENMLLAAPGREVVHGNASSLMVRRRVIELVGYFDQVRKGADTEYIRRIEAASGSAVYAVMPQAPLAIVRRSSGSLSRGEFKPGWRHPARASYRAAYSAWHEEIRKRKEPPYVANGGPRKFPVPRRFAPVQREGVDTFDVVFVVDGRCSAEDGSTSPVPEIVSLRRAGYRVGWCHVESVRGFSVTRESVRRSMYAQLTNLGAEELVHSDRINARLVVFTEPVLLQFTQSAPFAWSVAAAVVTVLGQHIAPDAPAFSVEDCARNTNSLLGCELGWAARDSLARSYLNSAVPAPNRIPRTIPIVYLPDLAMAREGGERPVIGRWCEHRFGSAPEKLTELLSSYPDVEDIDVRLLISKADKAALRRFVPERVDLVVPGEGEDAVGAMSTLDYYVRLDLGDQPEFPIDILGAITAGCIPILQPKHRLHVGDVALYCDKPDIAGLTRRLHENAELRDFVRERVAAAAAERFSPLAFVESVRTLIGDRTFTPEVVS